ncbi:hypothetical protein Patl1_31278 [Pistacia atlantica]|uniref:Uncharacterized protein n=1 Tax=Pistacia atlantica TaxID=434234 RepID=A0ACC1AFJ0_9ROSI|nr:hypothetical protein Patl1_31278 [Pistacia atlantica]
MLGLFIAGEAVKMEYVSAAYKDILSCIHMTRGTAHGL